MFAGECPSRAEVGGLFRLPLVFLAAFLPPEEAVGRQVVVLKSIDRSLWLYRAQGWEAKLNATREQLDAEQNRLQCIRWWTNRSLGSRFPVTSESAGLEIPVGPENPSQPPTGR
jgi:hypothetical protein